MSFNQSILFAMSRTMQDLDFVFVTMASLTIARRDSYLKLSQVWCQINTLAALRNASLHLALFSGTVPYRWMRIKSSNMRTNTASSHKNLACYHRNAQSSKLHRTPVGNLDHQPEKLSVFVARTVGVVARSPTTHHILPRLSPLINDNLCTVCKIFL